MKLKEELCGPNKQQECNLREITKILKDRCNATQKTKYYSNITRKLINTTLRNELLLSQDRI